jgi:NAD(P)-dependent dehydrogenase (short-subunit alcohol dehydrogenase family)
VVVVASDAYKFDVLDPDDYHSEQRWQPMKAYGRSKLCNLLFALELQQAPRRHGVAVSTVHPGFVSTSLGRDNRVATSRCASCVRSSGRRRRARARRSRWPPSRSEPSAARGFHVNGKRKALLPRATDPAAGPPACGRQRGMVGLDP